MDNRCCQTTVRTKNTAPVNQSRSTKKRKNSYLYSLKKKKKPALLLLLLIIYLSQFRISHEQIYTITKSLVCSRKITSANKKNKEIPSQENRITEGRSVLVYMHCVCALCVCATRNKKVILLQLKSVGGCDSEGNGSGGR